MKEIIIEAVEEDHKEEEVVLNKVEGVEEKPVEEEEEVFNRT
jgi:hypothetical protein